MVMVHEVNEGWYERLESANDISLEKYQILSETQTVDGRQINVKRRVEDSEGHEYLRI